MCVLTTKVAALKFRSASAANRPTLCDSVHHPSVAEVPGEVPSIFPVGPPLHPCANVGLPQRVLCDAQMVRAIVRLSVVKREGDTVWLWSEGQAQVNFFL